MDCLAQSVDRPLSTVCATLPENKDIRLQFPYTIKNCIRIFTFVNVLAALEDELLLGILVVIK